MCSGLGRCVGSNFLIHLSTSPLSLLNNHILLYNLCQQSQQQFLPINLSSQPLRPTSAPSRRSIFLPTTLPAARSQPHRLHPSSAFLSSSTNFPPTSIVGYCSLPPCLRSTYLRVVALFARYTTFTTSTKQAESVER